jgi:hypothetical protein
LNRSLSSFLSWQSVFDYCEGESKRHQMLRESKNVLKKRTPWLLAHRKERVKGHTLFLLWIIIQREIGILLRHKRPIVWYTEDERVFSSEGFESGKALLRKKNPWFQRRKRNKEPRLTESKGKQIQGRKRIKVKTKSEMRVCSERLPHSQVMHLITLCWEREFVWEASELYIVVLFLKEIAVQVYL